MLLWRISNHVTLDGVGGLLASGRWHTKGRRVVYCAPNAATALLEMLVRADIDLVDLPTGYTLLEIEAPDDVRIETIAQDDLPSGWRDRLSDTRALGDAWLGAGNTALLEVPCAIVPETRNMLINPVHPEADRIEIIQVLKPTIDQRLVNSPKDEDG